MLQRIRQPPTVERNIHFYRVDIGTDDQHSAVPFDPRPFMARVHQLPFTVDGRYQDVEDGGLLCCWPERATAPQRIRLGNVRRNALPLVEQGGRLSPLTIPATSGLAEPIHVVFFERNIVGVEFNFYGPRINRLTGYIAAKTPDLFPVSPTFLPLLRQDVRNRLARLEDVVVLDLSIRRGYAGVLAEANRDIFSGLDAVAAAAQAEEIEVILGPRRYSRRDRLSRALLEPLRRLSGRDDLRDNARRFIVKGIAPGGQVELIDVLSDFLIAKKRIVRQGSRSRALDSASAFASVEHAFKELRHELIQAARV